MQALAPLALMLALTALATPAAAMNLKFPKFTEVGCTSLPTLVCNVQNTKGFKTAGTVYFKPVWRPRTPGATKFTCYTRVTAAIDGLTNPKHGIHIHTYGDLSNEDGTSTGGHFTNPAGDPIMHALPSNATRHWGDLGNLVNDGSGMATYDRVDMVMRLGGIVGRAITIHEGEDQGHMSQPSGGSGDRIGFCVIGYSNPELLVS